ncbi:MAG: DinB family protein [Ignavibacteria bacterium]
MQENIKTEIWNQFGAALDMFENSLQKCPASLWDDGNKFWYNAYHCLFFTDYDLTTDPENFHPPEPYTLSEFDPSGIMPERIYTKEELIAYIRHCREKCRKLIGSRTEDISDMRWSNQRRNYSMIEHLLHSIRHVQHHTGQLNLMLGKVDHSLPIWVSQSKIKL